jgi:hypothetical protein
VKNKKHPTHRYRIRNWREYTHSLRQRGSLTVWCDPATVQHWIAAPTGRRGAPQTYSDLAVQCILTLQAVYRLPLRQTQGLVQSLVTLMGVDVPVPCYTTVSRRRATLAVRWPRRVHPAGEPLHLVIDSTGLKVFGEGEWKVRQHGYTKRRTWRKVHLGIDPMTHEIVVAGASTNAVHDSEMLPDLLGPAPEPLAGCTGDGAYDRTACYEALLAHRVSSRDEPPVIRIPPRRDAHIWRHGNRSGSPHPRDVNLRRIRQIGRAAWKRECGYHQRSLAETTMFRYKTIFGNTLTARTFDAQATEIFLRCAALNRMTHLGMPDTIPV